MNRLTNSDLISAAYSPWELCGLDKDCLRSCEECNIVEMYKKLAAYEDIGLKPEELQEMVDRQKWHVVAEGDLPEDDRNVLITYKSNIDGELNVDISAYCEATFGGRSLEYKEWGSLFPYFHANNEVIAWRELPEPWEGVVK